MYINLQLQDYLKILICITATSTTIPYLIYRLKCMNTSLYKKLSTIWIFTSCEMSRATYFSIFKINQSELCHLSNLTCDVLQSRQSQVQRYQDIIWISWKLIACAFLRNRFTLAGDPHMYTCVRFSQDACVYARVQCRARLATLRTGL